MADEKIDFTRSNQSGLKARFRQIRSTLDKRAARRAVYHRTVRELQASSDRDLAEFGFYRSDIPRIARQAAGKA